MEEPGILAVEFLAFLLNNIEEFKNLLFKDLIFFI
jgi:hypothetical protein